VLKVGLAAKDAMRGSAAMAALPLTGGLQSREFKQYRGKRQSERSEESRSGVGACDAALRLFAAIRMTVLGTLQFS